MIASSLPEGQGGSSESVASADVDAALLPDGDDLKAATEELEGQEADREEELAAPWAEAEREESQLAYKDLESAGAVSDLLRSTFGEELAKLDLDPARFLSDVTLRRDLGDDGGAVVTNEGQAELMEADIPAEVRDEDGQMSKVDLSLKATAEGFEPENPVVDLSIPISPAEGISIANGPTITQAGADPQSMAHLLGDKDVIYPEVQTDTDLLVSPLSNGVELFDQLRSPESPEILRFDLALPEGAELKANAGIAEVREGERLIGIVSPPHAVDAQGTRVPVTMDVQGSALVLGVAHRDAGYAYPILVDPEYTQNDWVNISWVSGNRYDVLEDKTFLANWNNSKILTGTTCINACWGSGRGLHISVPSGNYNGGQWAQWTYTPPGETTYLSGYLVNPFWRYDAANQACWSNKHPEPHEYDGLWSPTYGIYYQLYTLRALNGNVAAIYGNTAQTAKVMVIGMSTGGGSSDPCWRDLYAGGVATYMTDPDWPTLDPVSGFPSGWIDNSKTYGVNVSAHDAGLGVKNIWLNTKTAVSVPLKGSDCAGTHDSPCYRDMSGTIGFNGNHLDEGRTLVKVTAQDALARPVSSSSWWAYTDNTPPEVTLSGQLATETEEMGSKEQPPGEGDELSLPAYNLKIEATDGSNSSDALRRSGVKSVKVLLDGSQTPLQEWTNSTPCESCSLTKTFQLKLLDLAAGEHLLRVVATDQLNHPRERKIEFEYIPATGMKDEYVMHYFPLPDGTGNEEEEMHPDRPELAVNVMNGNLVYREQDIEVEGAAVDLEVERYYNSQLPEKESSEWGEGWTLAQTPALEPEEGPAPSEAEILDASGALNDGVVLPEKAGEAEFDPELQATIVKEADGGYELTDETGESPGAIAFNETGRAEALRTEGYAKVDYAYEGSELAEIEVQDPSTFSADSEELEIPVPELIEKPIFASAFGKNGSADGQLKSPADVAVDAAGNIWVADKANNRIQKFDPSGKFLFKFGSYGSANGQLSAPAALAIDAAGNIWVADGGNRRVQKFNSKGEYVAKFGSQGSGNGQFSTYGPRGIAIDASGNLWVSDYSSRIQKFNAAGEFVKVVGSGQFGESAGLDVGAGKVWVGDWTKNNIRVFSEGGESLFSFGSYGTGSGQFNHPDTVEVDAQGSVWVGDQSNHRIQQFDTEAKYLAQFGSYGAGEGQFSFAYPFGIETDGKGHLWVADVNNHRVQQWLVPIKAPAYAGSFGTKGSAAGQLSSPADVALGAGGSLWVADKANHRIQKFSPEGQFLFKLGGFGTGDGQFFYPTSVAVDRDGNLLVSDRDNHRVQKFDQEGNFIAKFGSQGSGNGQFKSPESIAADFEGNILVCDSQNGRIQRFDEDGKFLEVVSTGFSLCTGIDVGPDGRIWAGDSVQNRIKVFSEDGEFLFQFGSSGSGPGQFKGPNAIEVDAKGNVFVADQGNHRVQQSDSEAKYVRQFGSYGSADGQFSFALPVGIETDSRGHLWVADPSNHRVQRWLTANYAPADAEPVDLTDGDPAVALESEAGLIANVEGNAAGEHSYEHEGDLLTSHDGPEGESTYDYDEAERLSKVTLPNGAWAQIVYFSDSRVKSVTVDPTGSEEAKTTHFAYSDEPRRTTVTPPGAPVLTYDIGDDGSVVKWRNAVVPPEIILTGSIAPPEGEKPTPIWTGLHNLVVNAHSEHGIKSIELIANGNVLVDEKTCDENYETPEIECKTVINEWVTETENHAPGILNLEVLVEDSIEQIASRRFWVNIPPPPPPPPAGAPVKPKFKDILNFREEYGLEVVFPVNDETELNDRIFGLINAWLEGDPVARSSMERWGVPLRPADVAELEYRSHYIEVNAERIAEWAAGNYPSQYAGYYVDHRAGGIMHVGIVGDQSAAIQNLGQFTGLLALDRLQGFPASPAHSLAELESLQVAIGADNARKAPLIGLITRAGIDVKNNATTVGASDPGLVTTQLQNVYGAQAPLAVYHDTQPLGMNSDRWVDEGPVRGGHAIGYWNKIDKEPYNCTAGFGAWERLKEALPNGSRPTLEFVLTAGHCFPKDLVVRRFHSEADENPDKMGTVRRRANDHEQAEFFTDAEAIRLEIDSALFLRTVHRDGGAPMPVRGVATAVPGLPVSQSGVRSNRVYHGRVSGPAEVVPVYNNGEGPFWLVPTDGMNGEPGDSGAPVWATRTGEGVGLHVFGGSGAAYFTPMRHPPQGKKGLYPWAKITPDQAPGILHAPGMGELHIRLGGD